MAKQGRNGRISLTERQYNLLTLLSQGLPNKEIAHRMGTTVGTTKVNTCKLLKILRLGNRTEAATFLLRIELAHAREQLGAVLLELRATREAMESTASPAISI